MRDDERTVLPCTGRPNPHEAHHWSSFGEEYHCPGRGPRHEVTTTLTAELQWLTDDTATFIAGPGITIRLPRDIWHNEGKPTVIRCDITPSR